MALKTNYKDDVFTGARKYREVDNGDGTVSFVDETTYTQTGDTYGAAQINAQNQKINDLDTGGYKSTDAAETDVVDGDYFPFYDTSASTVKKTLWSNIKTLLGNVFAPKSHASTATTYGAGNASYYGHCKLSDNYKTSAGAASAAVGASSKAVSDCYSTLNSAIGTTNGNVSSLTNTVNGHTTTLNSHTTSINSLNTTVGNHATSINSLNTTVGNHTTSINSLNTTVGNHTTSINNHGTRLNTIEGELTANGQRIYMDYQGGKYGYNTSSSRGASTFHPFNDSSSFQGGCLINGWGTYQDTTTTCKCYPGTYRVVGCARCTGAYAPTVVIKAGSTTKYSNTFNSPSDGSVINFDTTFTVSSSDVGTEGTLTCIANGMNTYFGYSFVWGAVYRT